MVSEVNDTIFENKDYTSSIKDVNVSNDETPTDSFTINHADNSFSWSESEKKTSRKSVLLIIIGLLLALVLIYILGVFYFNDHLLPNTFISGFNSSYQTVDEVNEKLNQISHVRKVTLVGRNAEVADVKAEDIGLTFSDSDLAGTVLARQNRYLWPLYFLNIKSERSNRDYQINEEALNNILAGLAIVSGNQIRKTENAKAFYDGEKYIVAREVYGTEVNVENLKSTVKDALENGKSQIDLEQAGCYVTPTLTSDNPTLQNSVSQLNTLLNSKVIYDFKVNQEIVDKNTFNSWLTTDDQGNIVVVDANIAAYVQTLKDKYDTLGKEFSFTTSNGEPITLTNWYNGWEIDAEQEIPTLKENILSGQEITREPVYSSTGGDRSHGTTITGTYLEISIGDQMMWFYKDNELIVSTPVVTGDVTLGHGTTTGLYEIQAKSTDVVLRGDNGDGTEYASPVTFWMPFNGGIGVHDASWRSYFGGRIYRGNGSHGCVNTPYSAAKTIYNNILVGDPVVVY